MAENPLSGRGGEDTRRVRAEAIGNPGERRFRLLAIIDRETWVVWMEKEDLRRLGQALEQVLANLPDVDPGGASPSVGIEDFNIVTPRQMRAGRMELGYDEKSNRLILVAHDFEATGTSDSAFVCRLPPAVARDLAGEAATVVAAGRPRCPLCGMPVDADGHTCPKQNGHFPHRLEEFQEDDEDEDSTG